MLVSIYCTKNCEYQKDGFCQKDTTLINSITENGSCMFFIKMNTKNSKKTNFWTNIIQNYYS